MAVEVNVDAFNVVSNLERMLENIIINLLQNKCVLTTLNFPSSIDKATDQWLYSA